MDRPKVTIAVAIYNVPNEYLTQCIESLIRQTLKEIEILLISDNSCQDNVDLIREYARKDRRIRCIENQNNRRLAGVRNQSIDEAQGEYLCFVDNDDWLDLHMCEKAYEHAARQRADIVLWTYQTSLDGENQRTNYRGPQECLYETDEKLADLRTQILDPTYCSWQQIPMAVTAWAKLYRVEFLRHHPEIRFPEQLGTGGEDYVFNYQLFGAIKRAYFFEDYGYFYRQFRDSYTKKYREDEWDNRRKWLREVGRYVAIDDNKQRYVYERFCLNEVIQQLCVTQMHPACTLGYQGKKVELRRILQEDIIQQALRELEMLQFNRLKQIYFKLVQKKVIHLILLMSMLYARIIKNY